MLMLVRAFSSIQRQGLRPKTFYSQQIILHKGKYFTASGKPADSTTMSSVLEIDLRSDTVTKPSQTMRNAMATAPVGDDVFGEDPTVQALEQKSAQMLGMEAALYVPSGTMSNLIATLVHCNRRGSEMIVGNLSHMFLYEQGGAAQFGGVQINVVPNLPDGTFDLNAMQSRIRTRDLHEPMTALVCVENTHNKCGGKVLPLPWLKELVARCSALGLPLHMDGARLHNAAVYLGVPASQLVAGFASVSVCLSKSLGAPVGSLLHGSHKFIYEAKRMRKALGGGMRQCGIIAAAGIVALDTMIERLVDDHTNARALAQGIFDLNHPKFKVDVKAMQTNILIFQVDPAQVNANEFCQKLAETTAEQRAQLGGHDVCVKAVPFESQYIRMVLNHHVTPDLVQLAVKKIALVVSQY